MDTAVLILAVAVVFGLPTMILHDRLLRHQYMYHRRAWEADGSFHGLFWHVDGAVSSIQIEGFAPPNWGRTAWLWVYRTPEWADAPPPCRRLLYAYRVCSVLYAAATVAIIVMTLVAPKSI